MDRGADRRARLRRGSNRWTVLVGRWALKFPNPSSWRSLLYGLLNNMNERDASRRSDCGWGCPVAAHLPGGLLNVMPRCRELTDLEWERLECGAFLRYTGLEVELKRDSFGVLDGRFVAVDYGIPRERW